MLLNISSFLLLKISKILGKTEEAGKYQEVSDRAREAWQKEFIGKNGRLKPDRQATYVRALAFDLLPEGIRPQAARRLSELIKQNGYHIGTGFLSTTFINPILTQYGYEEDAYQLLLQETRPSWLYPVTKGATTIWEFWDVIKEDGTIKLGSMNHYSPGSVGSWLYQYVAGIRLDPAYPGYSRFIIHPIFGGGFSYAKASYISQYGKIISDWKLDNDTVTMKVSVPANSKANVVLPGARLNQVTEHNQPIQEGMVFSSLKENTRNVELIIGSGDYEFVFPRRS